jgi:hypothetical protein
MWAKFMDVRNGYTAEIIRDFLNHEGVAVRVLPPLRADMPMTSARELWVPNSKTHVAAELLRKI